MGNYNKAYKTKVFFGVYADKLLINNYEKIKSGGKVLDIGTGQGRNAFFLLEKKYLVHGIEPSTVAIELLKEQTDKQRLNFKLFNCNFSDFKSELKDYDAILVFGLIQILSKEQIVQLSEKIDSYLKPGGLVFITGFTKNEKVFMPKDNQWKMISESYFTDNKGNYRTFLFADELIEFFNNFNVIYKWEGLGEKHRHENSPEEQHEYFNLILSKKS